MEFKVGDRVHVTRFDGIPVDFYATISFMGLYNFEINNCSIKDFDNRLIAMSDTEFFGKYKDYYYTLVSEEAKGLRWSDGSSAEGTPIMCDEEDTEEPEVQRINDQFNFARSKKYDIQAKHC
ncbi:hypothetical protein [Mammaliicoccus sciuri]|uniref:hypothetical protein n=1 Tax=Mammaliicoccus sciuri TaxID=1296 RepID=UPI003F554240